MVNEAATRPGWQVSRLMTLNQIIGQGHGERATEHGIGGGTVRFHIPIYQRLYVWKKEQIERLLNDILDAWQVGKEDYFIGGTLVVERKRHNPEFHHLELIDGQQRLTTLLLTALYRLEGRPSTYRELLKRTEGTAEHWEPRLHFEIRDKANAWLHTALSDGLAEARRIDSDEDETRDGGIAALESGVEIIEEWFRNNSTVLSSLPADGQSDFDTYLLNSVRTLITSVPNTMDLNHLFETINDRSVQLEHHEVLKARILNPMKGGEEKVDNATYAACARIWEACSAMDEYWEDAIAEAAGKTKVKVFAELGGWDSGAIGGNSLLSFAISGKAAIKFCSPENADQGKTEAETEATLKDIVNGRGASSDAQDGADGEKDEDSAETQRATSLISFPMLLLHTLRIWLHRHDPKGGDLGRFDSLKLLEAFDTWFFHSDCSEVVFPDARERILSFIELLWEVRYLLDQHVIRWVELKEGGEWGHRILRLERNKSGGTESLRRADEEQADDKELSLIQSMLYHSQDIRQLLWLTPLLGYLHARTFSTDGKMRQPNLEPFGVSEGAEPSLTAFMRHLDNGLFSSPSLEVEDEGAIPEGSGTLMERSRAFLEKPWHSFKRPTTDPLDGGFDGSDDIPRTSHYWYYKVDFIIWRQYRGAPNSNGELPHLHTQDDITMEQLRSAWQGFRFTARTSVEHIHPQTSHELDQGDWSQEVLHSFGNLALVSRERNSEFSNLPYLEKRGKFITRLRKGDLESPKMALVYLYGGAPACFPQGEDAYQGKTWKQEQANMHLKEVKMCIRTYLNEMGRDKEGGDLAYTAADIK